jgi:outer membrane protein OmpA-like peptidoglycan-associated protein
MKKIHAVALILPIAAATACASNPGPTPQLQSARQAYSTAAGGPAASYAPDSLRVARDSLSRAEQANAAHDTDKRDFAILARTRAQVADARGRTAVAVQERDASRTRLAQAETQQALRAAAECQAQNKGVTNLQANPLDGLADRKEIMPGGMLYVIKSGLEFEKNKATLSQSAMDRLDKVADALKSEPKTTSVEVEGFTDPTGGPHINDPLSQRRAQAVAAYLKSRGVREPVRIRGLGSSQPIGNNATPEGRAENRRSEVLVRPK